MKYLFLILISIASLSLSAQDAIVRNGKKIVGLGTASDTLVADQVVNFSLELFGDVYGVLQLAIETDEISGTSAYEAYLQKSMNNEDWLNVDTVSHSGGGDNYEEYNLVNATHLNYRININATSATQKSNIKIWGKMSDGFVITE